jgi:hypothetical protein
MEDAVIAGCHDAAVVTEPAGGDGVIRRLAATRGKAACVTTGAGGGSGQEAAGCVLGHRLCWYDVALTGRAAAGLRTSANEWSRRCSPQGCAGTRAGPAKGRAAPDPGKGGDLKIARYRRLPGPALGWPGRLCDARHPLWHRRSEPIWLHLAAGVPLPATERRTPHRPQYSALCRELRFRRPS